MSVSISGLIFSNMHEEAMADLTALRSCGSVPFGGKYRLIDFAISNMAAGGITSIGIITKNNYKSLMDHVGSGRDWDLARKRGGLVFLPPYALSASGMYHGRLEAMSFAADYIRYAYSDWVVMCDCDYLFNIDIEDLAQKHIESGADVTCVYKSMEQNAPYNDNTAYEISPDGRINGVRIGPFSGGLYNFGLNMFFMSKKFFLNLVDETRGRGLYHFEKDVLQDRLFKIKINAYEVVGLALRIGSTAEYFSANMSLLQKEIRNELFGTHPVYTKVRDETPAHYGLNADCRNSLVADGCLIEGNVENCVLFRNVTVKENATVKNCIIMQGTVIGDDADISYAIIDKDCQITAGRKLAGCAENPVYVKKRMTV